MRIAIHSPTPRGPELLRKGSSSLGQRGSTVTAFASHCPVSRLDRLLPAWHQDAFGVDYDEYELLGMAIKFAGLYGKEVRIE